ncbi:uncharacterized protein LOC126745256 isoform X3 [Anthonomus grandis grandis]|uniref:uncharacterized protein LOC126745256 isoform X3 n=1 Tax=Anthonomus grandis grandis TaxID=2921223 RepID=UPI00216500F3|nr:uncharacterized protein LOC126745256 isoform X3 [Anthonomus grandis grandis]
MPNPNQVRIVVIDYYMSSPIPGLDLTYSEFRSSAITHVPVLRCFGSDKNGKKTCVHIHGVFPYLYIPYNGKGNSEEHMYKIAMALDKAINISFNQASSNAQHVYKICLVSGIPMYGYHLNQHQFFKIFLYNPALIAKVGDILLRRTALDEIYQPHEAHLNFTLQFMIDYNLHGMSSMLISDIKYRTNPDEKYSDLDETLRRPNIIKRTSICELEGDINAEHILNRQETVGVNPGIAALWDDEKLRRRNKGENSQLGNFLELQDIDTDSTKTHLIFQQSLRERLAVLVTNEDIQKQSLDVSIYPAEIPRHTKSNFQNASQIDIHSTSSLELSLDETFSVTCSQGLYDTITPNESQFDVSLDEEAQEFLNMLQHMANDKGAQNGVEEDEECILSQVEAEDVNDDSNEHFLDLSMPLESLATPTKSTNENILQLDGFVDDWLSDSDNESLATLRKKWHCEQPSSQLTENVTSVRLKCSKSMPLLESTCQVHKNQNNLFKHKEVQPDKLKLNVVVLLERIQVEKIANIEPLDLIKTLNKNVAAVKYPYFNKRSPEDIFEDNMRLIKFRMERLISRRKLKVIGDKLRIKYKKAVKLSKKISLSPKFNLVSAKRRWLESEEKFALKSTVLSQMLKLTQNYIDPDIYILLKFHMGSFFFYYGGETDPTVIEVPEDISSSEINFLIDTYKHDSVKYVKQKFKRKKVAWLQREICNMNRKLSINKKKSVMPRPCDLKKELFVAVEKCLLSERLETNSNENRRKPQVKKENNSLMREVSNANTKLQNHIDFLFGCGIVKNELPDKLNKIKCLEPMVIKPEHRNTNITLNPDKKDLGISLVKNPKRNFDDSKLQNVTIFDSNMSRLKKKTKRPKRARSLGYCKTRKNHKEITRIEKTEPATLLTRNVNVFNSFKRDITLINQVRQKYNSKLYNKHIRKMKRIKLDQVCNTNHNELYKIKRKVRNRNSVLPAKHKTDEIRIKPNVRVNLNCSRITDSILPNIQKLILDFKNINITDYDCFSSNNIISGETGILPRVNFYSKTDWLLKLILEKLSVFDLDETNLDASNAMINKNIGKCRSSDSCYVYFAKSPYRMTSNSSRVILDVCFREQLKKHHGKKKLTNASETELSSILKRVIKGEQRKINILSDIQIPSPFKVEFRKRSVSSIPFKSGTGVPTKRSRGESNNYSASEIVIQRTSSTPNMYFNCDGLVDSTSSDDEQGLGSKEKKSVKQPLDIIVKNSPRILENFQRGVAKNLPKADESDKYFQQTSAEETVILCTPSRAPDKRKHSFESKPLINKTISEYMQPTSVSNATTTSNEFMESSKEENLNLEVIRGQRKKTRNELVSKMEISNNYSSTVEAAHISEPVPYDLHIFCNDEKLNRSFFKSYLSVSEKYDIMQGYRTKQGCSTLLTQSSFSNSTVVKRCQDNKIIFNNSRLAKLSNQEKNFSIMNRVEFTTFKPASKAPTKAKVKSTLLKYGIPKIRPEEPFYNNVEDEKGAIEMGHRTLRISSKTTAHLAEFQSKYDGFNKYRKKIMEIISKLPWNSNNVSTLKISHCEDRRIIIRPLKKTPRIVSVKSWLVENVNKSENSVTEGHDYEANVTLSLTYCPPQFEISGSSLLLSQNSTSSVLEPSRTNSLEMLKLRDSIISSGEEHNSYEITGISQKLNKSVQNLQVARATTEHQYLTTMVMELHIRTRGDFKPDPQYDPICAIFYSILNDSPDSKSNINGVIAIDNLPEDQDAEISLFQSLVNLVKHWDPDIITGYEIEMLSWGYLIERAYVLSFDIIPMLGRSQLHRYGKMKFNRKLVDSLETSIIGRILLNVWRIMRQEIALQSYTFESIAYHILNRRISMFCFKQLTYFWDHRTNHYRHRVVNYYLLRVDTVLELFNKLDFLNRTSELAKLFGILFYEVLSRGSQFRVESMMLRLAKPLNYVPVSPSTEQRSKMKAPEYIPLVMEPESKLYTDPVIVLDFQSLYPSIIIAYNYCFTTCIGRVKYLGTNHPFEFGASQLKVPRKVVEKLCKRDLLNFSPCGVAFVKRKVREGILPRMLKEVLETRFMVKNAMKENKGNENLLKVLHNRQLGLKLIANVTYGYTAANFSGRMCCVEVGDSVVSKGRETLEHAIAVVEENAEWEAKVRLVVYGDTDSLFVLTPGKSKEEAFEIGRKIANAITKVNPDPVKLKLEKVYQPCILQTKKRYVGFMYESADQNEPVYEAKGIETVRRDGCPAVTKMLQKCLTLLFKTKDISLIKSYVLKQFNKIQAGRVSIQDLTFAKEYRGFTNYKPEACVPALELTRKWLAIDRRNEPRRGERVPYIVVNGPPSLPLIKLVRSPRELLNDNSLRPNVLYYISKVIIPPINRCLNLIGVDLNNWFHEMPRKTTLHLPNYSPTLVKSTISQYFISKICACCATPAQEGLCANCLKNPHISVLRLSEKLKKWEQNYHDTLLICQTCSCSLDEVVCNSLDCPVLYRRYQTISDHQQSSYVRELLNKLGAFSYDQWF